MITETLLGIVVDLVAWIVAVTPDFGLDLGTLDIASAMDAAGSSIGALNGWLPVTYFLASAVLLLTLQVVMRGWGVLVWLYHQFWGSE